MVHISNNPLTYYILNMNIKIENTYTHKNKYISALALTLPYITHYLLLCHILSTHFIVQILCSFMRYFCFSTHLFLLSS